jgi:phosphotransferase system  glucose/maltose/N-acetylglucosamine-specific IIC component
MKQFMQIIKRPFLSIVSILLGVVSFAQDKTVDVNINTNSGGNWYAQPWVWIVGAAVFILLLVALTRSGSKSDA